MTVVYAGRISLLGAIWDYRHPASGETVLNVEGACRKVLAGNPRAMCLDQSDWDDALRHLLGEVIVIADGYKPRDAGSRLGGYVTWKLKFALIDYLERRDGRHGEKRVADTRFAEAAARDNGAFADGDPGVRGSLHAAGGGQTDPEPDRAFPRGWTERPGDRPTVRPIRGLGRNADPEGEASADPRGSKERRRNGAGAQGEGGAARRGARAA